jgi:hypothetical protein
MKETGEHHTGKYRTLVAGALTAWLFLHFGLTLIYNFQQLPVPGKIRNFSNAYCAPLFHQNWKLFAPDLPEYNVNLESRFYKNGQWLDWKDVSEGNGFAADGKMEYVEQSITSGLAYQVANNLYTANSRVQFDHIVESNEYHRAIYFAAELARRVAVEDVGDSIQLRLQFRFTPSPDKARTRQFSQLVFPSYDLRKEARP